MKIRSLILRIWENGRKNQETRWSYWSLLVVDGDWFLQSAWVNLFFRQAAVERILEYLQIRCTHWYYSRWFAFMGCMNPTPPPAESTSPLGAMVEAACFSGLTPPSKESRSSMETWRLSQKECLSLYKTLGLKCPSKNYCWGVHMYACIILKSSTCFQGIRTPNSR